MTSQEDRRFSGQRKTHPSYPCKKGQAAEANTVIVMVVLLTFFSIYIYMANTQTQANIRLNLESLEIIKLKSTFELFNQSLGTTWFISTVQSVFNAADESVGCGYDNTWLEAGFWYQGKKDRARDFYHVNFTEFSQTTGKYNKIGANPQICYPRDSDIESYINVKLQDYAGLVKKADAGGVQITRGDPTVDMSIDEKSVVTKFTQDVIAEYGRGTIKTKTENTGTMYTALRNMTDSGRSLVEGMVVFGDGFYNPANSHLYYNLPAVTPSAYHYKNTIASLVASFAAQTNPHPEIKTDVMVESVELSGTGLGKLEGSGLMVDYKATVRYSEAATVSGAENGIYYDWPTESRSITSCFGYRKDPIDDAGRAHNGIDIGGQLGSEIKSIAAGTVAEVYSSCTATSGAACGNGYGNYVLIRHEGFLTFYAHLASAGVQTGQDIAAGEVIGLMGSTGRSTGYHLHFEVRNESRRVDPCGYIDCSLSIGKKCAVLGVSEFDYYYHDSDTDTFEKRPVTLEVKVEDHLPVLDCIYWNEVYINTYGRAAPVMFNYEASNDIACCNGYLFTCDSEIEGVPTGQQFYTGESTGYDEDLFTNQLCNSILSGKYLACGMYGFELTD